MRRLGVGTVRARDFKVNGYTIEVTVFEDGKVRVEQRGGSNIRSPFIPMRTQAEAAAEMWALSIVSARIAKWIERGDE